MVRDTVTHTRATITYDRERIALDSAEFNA